MSLLSGPVTTQHAQPAPIPFMHSFFKAVPHNIPKHHRPDSYSSQHAGSSKSTLVVEQSLSVEKAQVASEGAVEQNDLDSTITLEEQIPSGHAFDPVGDRRKRRKVSQSPEAKGQKNLPVQTTLSADDSNVDQTQICDSTQNVSRNTVGEHATASLPSANICTATPTTPKRRRGRPPKVVSANAVGTDQQLRMSNRSSAEHEISPQKRTPKKRTIQIGANGKLLQKQSPPKTTKSPRPVRSTAIKSTHTVANLKLKNGGFTRCLIVIFRFEDVSKDPKAFGDKVQGILSRSRDHSRPVKVSEAANAQSNATTHPFFSSKPKGARVHKANDVTTGTHATGEEVATSAPGLSDVPKPVAWKDLVFKSNRASYVKGRTLEKPSWPPLNYQHVGSETRASNPHFDINLGYKNYKAKNVDKKVNEQENILNVFAHNLVSTSSSDQDLQVPLRVQCSAQQAMNSLLLENYQGQRDHINLLARTKALHSRSAFDKGQAPGPWPWTQQYCPSTWSEVLQPSTRFLYEWLQSLAVHNVKQGLDPTRAKDIPKRRKRAKKRDDEFDDFIVDDVEEQDTKVKTAMLIIGPHGCGKTASVYTVAKQLGFEVFEIHAGMRRSQKDIFDKVGDMALNHMVQGGQTISRDSSVVNDTEFASGQEDFGQESVAAFFKGPAQKSMNQTNRPGTPLPNKQEQKQSLILFEEVDQIFEDDRGFWTGVQTLIQTSKRPVVLTCNSLDNVPMQELGLQAILTYQPPSSKVVSEYLTYVAFEQGHLIQREAIQSLYRTKGNDLRATMTELDFWCQMTVGSRQGGLDWFPMRNGAGDAGEDRIFSQDTYYDGLHVMPTTSMDLEESLRFANQVLELPLDLFVQNTSEECQAASSESSSKDDLLALLEGLSDGDMIHNENQPALYSTLPGMPPRPLNRTQLVTAIVKRQDPWSQDKQSLFDCLHPLNQERSVFPPTQGRLAPSLDMARIVLATDIAPYVRSIAVFDQRLEKQREEVDSSQGKKTRTTRAARAAAEGGDKASTRMERWFPLNLDLQMVLRTGNGWPQWLEQDEPADVSE